MKKSTKTIFLTLLILSIFTFVRCSGDDDNSFTPITVSTANNIHVKDIANAGNGSDLQITFSIVNDISTLQELRIIVVPSSNAIGFNLDKATSLSNNQFTVVNYSEGANDVILPADMNDSEGNTLVNQGSYEIFAHSVAKGENIDALSASVSITLEVTDILSTLVTIPKIGTGGLTVDASGNIYTANFGETLNGGGTEIYKVTPEGEYSVFARGINTGTGNVFDANGVMYQSSFRGHVVHRISADGSTVEDFLTKNISNPSGIAIDTNGDIYVANFSTNTILKVSPEGEEITTFSGNLNGPNGLTLDEENNMYACNFKDGNIVKITPDGNASILVTLPGNQVSHVKYLKGSIYAVASGSHSIYKISLDGGSTLIAGNGQAGHVDGNALAGSLNNANGLAFDPTGNILYINEVGKTVTAGSGVIFPTRIRVLRLEKTH